MPWQTYFGGNYTEKISMQTFCVTACKYYSFLLICVTRATSFDSSLAHFGDNCFKKNPKTTCFYLISIKKLHLHCSLSCGRLCDFSWQWLLFSLLSVLLLVISWGVLFQRTTPVFSFVFSAKQTDFFFCKYFINSVSIDFRGYCNESYAM